MPNKVSTRKKPVYVFIDTNIFLDFYRGNKEASISLLRKIDSVKDRVISTYQVEMEFKKNRQNVLYETFKNIDFNLQLSLPAIFRDSATGKSLDSLTSDAKDKVKILKKRFSDLFYSPKLNDEVFRVLENVFHNPSEHVLTRDMKIRHEMKRLAWRRFILGYPPRKKNDTSIGDALNWEWIINCGKKYSGKIIIVSRDGDYGISIKDDVYLNDHLYQEYKERVGLKREIMLTNKLSDAFRELDVPITKQEVTAEKELVEEGSSNYFNEILSREYQRVIEKIDKDAISNMFNINPVA
jgi:predicted nucleic acid-binding protein